MGYKFVSYEKLKQQGRYNPYKFKGKVVGKGLWFRTNPNGKETIVQPGNRIKNSDGSYIQLNSDGTTTLLKSKDNKFTTGVRLSQADKQNMLNGNVFDASRKWGLDTNSTVKTYTDKNTGRTYFKDRNGQWISFQSGLGLKQDQQLTQKKLNARLAPKNRTLGQQISDDGVVSGLINSGADALGIGKDSWLRTGAGLLGTTAYAIPIVGTGLSIYDAYNAASKGDYGGALASIALGVLPGGRLLKGVTKLGRRGLVDAYKVARFGSNKNPISFYKDMKRLRQSITRTPNTFGGNIKTSLYGGYQNPFGLSKGWNRAGNIYTAARTAAAIGGLGSSAIYQSDKEENRQNNIKSNFLNENSNWNTIRNYDLDNTNEYIMKPNNADALKDNEQLNMFRNAFIYD